MCCIAWLAFPVRGLTPSKRIAAVLILAPLCPPQDFFNYLAEKDAEHFFSQLYR